MSEEPVPPPQDRLGAGAMMCEPVWGEELGILLQESYGPVLGFFRSRGFPDDEARDLTQETFCRATRKIHSLRSTAAFGSWILGIAANVWKNTLRHRKAAKRDAPEVSLDGLDPGGEVTTLMALEARGAPSPLDELLTAECLEHARACLDALQPRTRRCLVLYVFQQRSYQEIADLLQISVPRARSHIHKGRRALKKCFELHLAQGGP
jgi:RNA polymerase sigma-70 factor, ECF subfamily